MDLRDEVQELAGVYPTVDELQALTEYLRPHLRGQWPAEITERQARLVLRTVTLFFFGVRGAHLAPLGPNPRRRFQTRYRRLWQGGEKRYPVLWGRPMYLLIREVLLTLQEEGHLERLTK